MTERTPYDAIVIGGGPAGLTCAIFLGRYRRRVLLLDDGQPRNDAAHAIHGFLGQHGIEPHELRARGRAEAEAAGVEISPARAQSVARDGDLFVINAELRARRLDRGAKLETAVSAPFVYVCVIVGPASVQSAVHHA